MQRVLVIGSGGAGKSTFARRLAAFTRLPLYHLDRLFWHPNWTRTPEDTWQGVVQSLIATDRWIMDGNYGGTSSPRMRRADTIIWIDYSRFTCFRRAFWRGLSQFGRTREHDMAPGCAERLDPGFLSWVWNYNKRERPMLKRILRELPAGKRILIFHSDDHAARWLLRVHHDYLNRDPYPAAPTIRLALPRDAHDLARIHVEGWQSAYRHIFPPEAFALRTIESREAEWSELLESPPEEQRVYVSEVGGEVAGFAYTRPGLDTDLERPGELKLMIRV
ncbi:MAG: hypothetical protein J5I90_07620 [Caldilineales bacterium]|nr:hypothetical protein [Caldilineales bacterium]